MRNFKNHSIPYQAVFLTLFQLRKTLGQRGHSVLRYGENQSIGKTLLQRGVGKETGDELLQTGDPVAGRCRRRAIATHQFHLQSVAGAVKVLQVLRRADASQLALHHYADSRTQRVGLLHRMGGQYGTSATLLADIEKKNSILVQKSPIK